MLTVKQPPTYGYKSVHDLPTPPSTSRPSPPLIYQESISKSLPVTYRSHSPPTQPMSAPHRGLPPPAAMTLPPQQPPNTGVPPPAHHAPPPPPPPPSLGPSHQQRDSWAQLPAPPPQWQGAEEPMKHWLQARAEEDKRKQEEERTRQESLRLEQRKVEMDMLRTSLSGGIPPAMVPLVFAGMGGSGGALSQVALEWTQQFMPQSQPPRPQLMPPQGAMSPEHQREVQPAAPGQYHNLPPVPPPAPPGYAYPGSPPTRPRGQTSRTSQASTPMCHNPHTAESRQWQHIRTCNRLNLLNRSLKQVRQYTSTTGSHQRRRLATAQTDREALPGRLPESARPRGNTSQLLLHLEASPDFDPLRRLSRADSRILPSADGAATHAKGATSRPIDLPGRGALAERASEAPCAACRRYVAQPQGCCRTGWAVTEANLRSTRSRQCCRRSPDRHRDTRFLHTPPTKVSIDFDGHPRPSPKRRLELRERRHRVRAQGRAQGRNLWTRPGHYSAPRDHFTSQEMSATI
ncbi:hypothetical protein BKA56DRAFT_484005 [Ilyonectria sp. MPI-CAGE-AT-0026]|nr:hypothetical protein BKA56DRAFT_484005 [Ilyonectria sp. MPI-CAGE-AT-0026]